MVETNGRDCDRILEYTRTRVKNILIGTRVLFERNAQIKNNKSIEGPLLMRRKLIKYASLFGRVDNCQYKTRERCVKGQHAT